MKDCSTIREGGGVIQRDPAQQVRINDSDFLPSMLPPEPRMPAVYWFLIGAMLSTLTSPVLTTVGPPSPPAGRHNRPSFFLVKRSLLLRDTRVEPENTTSNTRPAGLWGKVYLTACQWFTLHHRHQATVSQALPRERKLEMRVQFL